MLSLKGHVVNPLGGNQVRIGDSDYELPAEIENPFLIRNIILIILISIIVKFW